MLVKVLSGVPGSGQWGLVGARLLDALLRWELHGSEAREAAKKLISRIVTDHPAVIEKIVLHTRAMPGRPSSSP